MEAATSTPFGSPTPSRLRPGHPRGPLRPWSVKLGCEWEREGRQHARARARVGGHPAPGRQTPPLPELRGRAGGGGSQLAPGSGTKLPPRPLGERVAPLFSSVSPAATLPPSPRASGPPWGPRGPRGGPRGAPRVRARSPAPRPPPLTCSALCGAAGARRPGRRRTGCRHRRPPPAGSRWWSPLGSAGRAAAAAAAAAPAPGGSSRRRRRSERSPAHRAPAPGGEGAEDPAGGGGGGGPAGEEARRGGTPGYGRCAATAQPAAHSFPVPGRPRSAAAGPGAPRHDTLPKSWRAPPSGRARWRAGTRSCPGSRKTPGERGAGAPASPARPVPRSPLGERLRRLSPLWSRGSRSESPRVNPEREGRRRGSAAGRGGPGRGARAPCSRQRALPSCLGSAHAEWSFLLWFS